MKKLLAIVTLASGVTLTVYLAASGDPGPANRVATCGVRVDDDLLALARDAGFVLARYERVRIPIVRTVLADGGVSIDLPPGLAAFARGLEVRDWEDCVVETCTARPGVCARWDAGVPFTIVGAAGRPCVRANLDAGLLCLRRWDGGSRSIDTPGQVGGGNVGPASEAVDVATCQRVECSLVAGENPEVELE